MSEIIFLFYFFNFLFQYNQILKQSRKKILWDYRTYTMRKVWILISKILPIRCAMMMIKCTTCEVHHLILLKMYGNWFPSLSPFDGFCCFFPCNGKLMRKPMHFASQQKLNVDSMLIYFEIRSRRRSTWYPRWFIFDLSTLIQR